VREIVQERIGNMLVDTHTHVNFNAFKEDGDRVIRRSLDSSVWMINVGSQASTSARAVKIAEKYEKGVYAAVGLHPIHLWESYHDFSELSFKTQAEELEVDFYKNLAASKKVVAIGEIGLDYYHLPKDRADELKKKQKEVLIKQIELAQELDLPVIFHCRDAYEDLLEIIKKMPKISRGVLHCFADTMETAEKFLKFDFMVSFTGIITYPKAESVREVARKVPLEKIMIETDAPYLAPQQVRGQRNEPIYVKYVAEEIARVRGLSFDEVAKATTENAIKFFRLK
jgi:TatD DNase family protein